MKSCSAKTALVTGASTGIGKAIAVDLAKRGAKLILVARSKDLLDQLATELQAGHGTDVTVIVMDLAKPGAAAQLFADVTARGLSVDLLINNAGFGKWGHFGDVDAATYADMVDLNIKAVVDLCHVFLPGMATRGDCGILNVASVAAFVPLPWSTVYAATKAFVLSFSEALYYEYRDKGVMISALCPGATNSQFAMTAYVSEANRASFGDSAESVAKVGLDALLAGKQSVIPGFANQFAAILPRLLPRSLALSVVATAWRQILKTRGLVI